MSSQFQFQTCIIIALELLFQANMFICKSTLDNKEVPNSELLPSNQEEPWANQGAVISGLHLIMGHIP
jgi:hypothetical protein